MSVTYIPNPTEKSRYGIILENINLPDQEHTLRKIWTIVKRRYQETFNFCIVGNFLNGQNGDTHTCIFWVSTAHMNEAEGRAHTEAYAEIFPLQMQDFVDTINDFITSEEQREAENANREAAELPATTYRSLVTAGSSEATLDEYLNDFLRELGYRNESDDRRTAKERKRAAWYAEMNEAVNKAKRHLTDQGIPQATQNIMFHAVAFAYA